MALTITFLVPLTASPSDGSLALAVSVFGASWLIAAGANGAVGAGLSSFLADLDFNQFLAASSS